MSAPREVWVLTNPRGAIFHAFIHEPVSSMPDGFERHRLIDPAVIECSQAEYDAVGHAIEFCALKSPDPAMAQGLSTLFQRMLVTS